MESNSFYDSTMRDTMDSDEDMFEPRSRRNRPPSPFPFHEDANDSFPSSPSISMTSSSSVVPPVAGLKKLKLNESVAKASSGAIPKKASSIGLKTTTGQRSSIAGAKFFVAPTPKPASAYDLRSGDAASKKSSKEYVREHFGNRPFFKSLSTAPASSASSPTKKKLHSNKINDGVIVVGDNKEDDSQSLTALLSSNNNSGERKGPRTKCEPYRDQNAFQAEPVDDPDNFVEPTSDDVTNNTVFGKVNGKTKRSNFRFAFGRNPRSVYPKDMCDEIFYGDPASDLDEYHCSPTPSEISTDPEDPGYELNRRSLDWGESTPLPVVPANYREDGKTANKAKCSSVATKPFRHSDSDLDEPVRAVKTYKFTKPNISGSTSSASASAISVKSTVEADRHSSGYVSDTEDAVALTSGGRNNVAAKSSSFTTLPMDDSDATIDADNKTERTFIVLSSDDETESRDATAKPVNANRIMPNIESDRASSSTTSSIRSASSTSNSSRSLRSRSSPSVISRVAATADTSGFAVFSGIKRKRNLGNARTGSNESNQRRPLNVKRNSSRPATAAQSDSDSDDVQMLATVTPATGFASPEVCFLGETTLNAIDQLESDEAYARQLQAEYDSAYQFAELVEEPPSSYRVGNRIVRRNPNYRRDLGDDRNPGLPPDSSTSGARRRPFGVRSSQRRNATTDSPSFRSLLFAWSDLASAEPDRPPPHGRRLNSDIPDVPSVPGRSGLSRYQQRLLQDRIHSSGGSHRRPTIFESPLRPGRFRRSTSEVFNDIDQIRRFRDIYTDELDFESLLELAELMGEGRQGLQIQDIERHTTKKMYSVEIQQSSSNASVESVAIERETCSICMCDYDNGNELRILPCIHNFHKDCVDKWLKANATCPICRVDLRQ